MARRIVSVLRAVPGAARAVDPALEANAFAVAEDVDLQVLLRDAAVTLAVAGAEIPPPPHPGVPPPGPTPRPAHPAQRASGSHVHADAASLARLGLTADDLVPGVAVVDDAAQARLLRDAQAVVVW